MKKKLLCTGIAAMILASPITVFADDTTNTPRTRCPQLTSEQAADMETYRAYVDDYLAGKITLEELKTYHDELIPAEIRRDDTNFETIMQLRKDYADGKITREEFRNKMYELRPERADRPNKPNRGDDSEHGNRHDSNSKMGPNRASTK